MTVKSSISLTDAQDAFVRRLVAEGRYSSVSAVLQQGLELLRRETDETEALRLLLEQRRKETPISFDELERQVRASMMKEEGGLGLDA
jgi:antitoxin ParD1/3/4